MTVSKSFVRHGLLENDVFDPHPIIRNNFGTRLKRMFSSGTEQNHLTMRKTWNTK